MLFSDFVFPELLEFIDTLSFGRTNSQTKNFE